jgi:hypothetical protein
MSIAQIACAANSGIDKPYVLRHNLEDADQSAALLKQL